MSKNKVNNNILLKPGGGLTNDSTDGLSVENESIQSISMIAGEDLTAGQPVSLFGYQADGGIVIDSKTNASITASEGSTESSADIIVPEESNTMIVVVVSISNNSVTSIKWNTTESLGLAVYKEANYGNIKYGTYIYYLANPTAGTHKIDLAFGWSNGTGNYSIYVLHNVSATIGNTNTSSITTGFSGSVGHTIAPYADLSLVITSGYGVNSQTLSNITNINSNKYTDNKSFLIGDGGIVYPNKTNTYSLTSSVGIFVLASVEIKPFTTPTFPSVVKAGSVTPANTDSIYKHNVYSGFALDTVSTGEQVRVQFIGRIANQTSLVPGQIYYLQDTAGTIGVSPGTNEKKVGIAISSTELLLQ